MVEQALWLAEEGSIELEHLPDAVRNKQTLVIGHERRRQVADQLFETLVAATVRSGRTSIRCSSSAI